MPSMPLFLELEHFKIKIDRYCGDIYSLIDGWEYMNGLTEIEKSFREICEIFPEIKEMDEYITINSCLEYKFKSRNFLFTLTHPTKFDNDDGNMNKLSVAAHSIIGKMKKIYSNTLYEFNENSNIEDKLNGEKDLILNLIQCPYCGEKVDIPKSGYIIKCNSCGRTIYLRAK